MVETEDARKNVIKADAAWDIIVKAETLSVGRGKKVQTFVPAEADKEEVLKVCLGRTGNMRAPTVIMGKSVYVGYNDAMYQELMAS